MFAKNWKAASWIEKRPSSLSCMIRILCRVRGCETVTTTYWSYFEVQRGVFGMAAFIDKSVGSLVRGENCHESITAFVRLAEVSTQSALSVIDS